MVIYVCDICKQPLTTGDLLVQKIGEKEQYHIECYSEKFCKDKE